LATLASDAPTPGGGAAAAMTAAQGVALLAMVARLTKTKSTVIDWQQHIIEMDAARETFGNLATEDALAFNEVMKTYSLPKGDERTQTMQKALKSALQPPLKTILLTNEILSKLIPYIEAGNKNVITDSGIAVALMRAAIESSAYNVEINLKFIQDKDFVKEIREKIKPILEGLEKSCGHMSEIVYARIS